jgi:hypothetical protein
MRTEKNKTYSINIYVPISIKYKGNKLLKFETNNLRFLKKFKTIIFSTNLKL